MTTNPNMVAIQTVTVGAGGAASIDFTSIPQTYTDLVVKISARSNSGSGTADNILVQFNNSTASVYSFRYIEGNGSSASSASGSGSTSLLAAYTNRGGSTSNTFDNSEIYIPNYTSTTNAKSVSSDSVVENNATLAYNYLAAGLWNPGTQAAITSIKLFPQVGTGFVQHTTATLYGVTSAAVGAKATGGIITSDANFFYHTFLASGTFTPTQNITADCLVVAGGGGGLAGGGGGGGLLTHTSQSLTAQGYTVTVGAGGASYVNGSNSQFGSLTASVGGGRGGGNSTTNAAGNGGSGGGSMGLTSSPFGALAGGTGTAGQGNNGGSGFWGDAYAGGGGGGAGAVGGNSGTSGATNSNGGAGGAGLASSFSGTSVTYAGGGGGSANLAGTSGWNGGAGGSGGGGAGTTTSTGVAGTANTGGGGGGGQTTGGNGGSGIVIVRYAR